MYKLGLFLIVLASACANANPHVNYKLTKDVGVIGDFQVSASTSDTITLSWTMSETTDDFLKCTVTRDAFWNNDVICSSDTSCSYTEEGLEPCVSYSFIVVCYYMVGGKPAATEPSSELPAFTEGSSPGTINNLAATGQIITWDTEPCSSQYEACYHIRGSDDGEICNTTPDPTFDLGGLQLCSDYDVRVHGLSSDGTPGPSSTITITTEEGVPSPVTHVIVNSIGENEIMISFNQSEVNPQCANGFSVSVGETHNLFAERMVKFFIPLDISVENYQHHMNISDLLACTAYTIDVFAVTTDQQFSDAVTVFTETAESAPSPPLDIEVVTHPDGTVTITWVTDPSDRCAADVELCFTSNGGFFNENCTNAGGNSTINYGPLEKCLSYQVVLLPQSPSGITGPPIVIVTDPIDARPSAVTNYVVKTVSSTEITVEFDEPEENAKCVQSYGYHVVNLNETGMRSNADINHYSNTFKNLEPCCAYQISTQAVSRTGLQSEIVKDTSATDEDLPSAPTKAEWLEGQTTSTGVYIKWWRPASYYFCINHYIVRYSTEGGASGEVEVMNNGSVFEVRHYVDGLESCKQYDILISGITPSGQETETTSLMATTKC